MNNLASLFTSKKSGVAMMAILVITFTDPRVAEWLPNLSDTHVVCLTVIVSTLIVVQGAVDMVEIIKGKPPETAVK